MLWIASYPRSGVTFLRIVLKEIYGLDSSTYHKETAYPVDADYDRYPTIKTHLLPHELEPNDPHIPAVYLERDGRDCVVSMAHQRSDIVCPGSDFYMNLQEAIRAEGGSHFGGWSRHVRMWRERAALVIKFEELIRDPVECIERIRPFYDLPQPNRKAVPTFAGLKSQDFSYGSGIKHGFSPKLRQKFRSRFFRRGRSGSWRDEMPEELHRLFLQLHGDVLAQLGYFTDSDLTSQDLPELGFHRWAGGTARGNEDSSIERRFIPVPRLSIHGGPDRSCRQGHTPQRRSRILIEAWKLMDSGMDGDKRYVRGLIKGLRQFCTRDSTEFDYLVHLGGNWVVDLFSQEISALLEDRAPEGCPDSFTSFRRKRRLVSGKLGFLLGHGYWMARRKLAQRERKGVLPDFDLLHLTSPAHYHALMEHAAQVVTTVHQVPQIDRHSRTSPMKCLKMHIALQTLRRSESVFVTSSKSEKDRLLAKYGLPSDCVYFVPDPCDRALFRPVLDRSRIERARRRWEFPDGNYFLCMSDSGCTKSLKNLIRAFNALISTEHSPELHLAVMGLPGERQEQLLKRRTLRLDRVIFRESIPEEDLPELHSDAMAFCYLPREDMSNLPALEAIGCGAPVLYPGQGSTHEVVMQGGLGVNFRDVDDIFQKLALLAYDHEARESLSWDAQKRASIYQFDEAITRIQDVYRLATSCARCFNSCAEQWQPRLCECR